MPLSFAADSDLPPTTAATGVALHQSSDASPAQPHFQLPSQAGSLLQLLTGCCHPRAERLREQLNAHPDTRKINELRDEVLRLLTVCYNADEVRRRLHELV
jgi:hypothetical protein